MGVCMLQAIFSHGKDMARKRMILRDAMLWHDPPEYYSTGRYIQFEMAVPSTIRLEGGFEIIEVQLQQAASHNHRTPPFPPPSNVASHQSLPTPTNPPLPPSPATIPALHPLLPTYSSASHRNAPSCTMPILPPPSSPPSLCPLASHYGVARQFRLAIWLATQLNRTLILPRLRCDDRAMACALFRPHPNPTPTPTPAPKL